MLDKKRATQAEDKAIRKASILEAAATLLMENPQQLPSVIRIAQASQLAKGTVYLYFSTKEEIFQALLEEKLMTMLDGLKQGVLAGNSVEKHINSLVYYIKQNPSLLPLASMAKSVLEQNLDALCGEAFKKQLAMRVRETALALEGAYPSINNNGEQLIVRSFAITIGLWQMLDWPNHLKHLLEGELFSAFNQDYYSELQDMLMQLWKQYVFDV